jgi:hypothetical protein
MKAISLWEPWATAIAIGAKTIETRHWPTRYRGPLAIHAAKYAAEASFILTPAVKPAFETAGITKISDLSFGKIVATCCLVGCVRTEDLSGKVPRLEYALGNYGTGRFGWILKDVVRLPEPILAKGSQGFWEWGSTDVAAIDPQISLGLKLDGLK